MIKLLCLIGSRISGLITGWDPVREAYLRGIKRCIMAGKGLMAAVRKLFLSTASSTAGTRVVLVLHTAMTPEGAKITNSSLYNPTINKSIALLKFDFRAG